MLALRDVELAIDESILRQVEETGRKTSQAARLCEADNPFEEMGARLSSRRVRPAVVELIQALGHYIDAVWAVEQALRCGEAEKSPGGQSQNPGSSPTPRRQNRRIPRPCPWAAPIRQAENDSSIPLSTPNQTIQNRHDQAWISRMLTAVAQARSSGHLSDPPTQRDLAFWEMETKCCIRDVEDVVGIYKGVKWAFTRAFMDGEYGEVERGNVLVTRGKSRVGKPRDVSREEEFRQGDEGRTSERQEEDEEEDDENEDEVEVEGGNMVRLLNDLEEALW